MIFFSISNSYPADLGTGYIWLDWLCMIFLFLAGAINGYLALYRVNSPSGIDLIGRRMVAVGFFGQCLNLVFRTWQNGGDLLVSPQAEMMYILVGAGSCLLGYNRIKYKRAATQ